MPYYLNLRLKTLPAKPTDYFVYVSELVKKVMLHQLHNAPLASTGYVTPEVSGSDHWSNGYYDIPLCSHMFWIPDPFPEFSLLLRPSAVGNWRMRLEMTFQNEFQLHHNVTVWGRAEKLRKGSEIKQTQSGQSLQCSSFHHIKDIQFL